MSHPRIVLGVFMGLVLVFIVPGVRLVVVSWWPVVGADGARPV
jgi:hypothetical protein